MPRLTHRNAFAAGTLALALGCADVTGPEREISGKRMYDQYCARCHGIDGGGVSEMPATMRRLDDARVMAQLSDERIKGVIRMGVPGPTPQSPPAMPGFADEFTEASLLVLLAYVRSLSGTEGRHGAPSEDDEAEP